MARAWLFAAIFALVGCAARAPDRVAVAPTSPGAPRAPTVLLPPSAPVAMPSVDDVQRLGRDEKRLALPAGRSIVEVAIAPHRHVSILVTGRPDALLGFDVIGPPALLPLRARAHDEDGLLPRALSFRAPAGADAITLLVDVHTPIEIARAMTPIPDASALFAPLPPGRLRPKAPKDAPPLALIGLPVPASRDEGYTLLSPGRYHFMRVDAAEILLFALKQTRRRFRRDPVGIADISQWDGRRPASDLDAPRHLSHAGGRDVDVAFPASADEPSTVRPHCSGVLLKPEWYVCHPGSARGLDAMRLAYLMGLLFDGPPKGAIERVFMDDVYIQEMRGAAKVLKERRWIKDAGFEGLFDDRVVRASPWHVDHFHVRFTGGRAQPIW